MPLDDSTIEMILDLRKELYLGENSPLIPDENGDFTRPVISVNGGVPPQSIRADGLKVN